MPIKKPHPFYGSLRRYAKHPSLKHGRLARCHSQYSLFRRSPVTENLPPGNFSATRAHKNASDKILRRKTNSRVTLLYFLQREARRTCRKAILPPQKISKVTVAQEAKIARRKLSSQLLRRGDILKGQRPFKAAFFGTFFAERKKSTYNASPQRGKTRSGSQKGSFLVPFCKSKKEHSPIPATRENYTLATPLRRAASATAVATASRTRGSNALGKI